MIDVLIISGRGVARVFLADVSWLSELAALSAIIVDKISICAVPLDGPACDRFRERWLLEVTR